MAQLSPRVSRKTVNDTLKEAIKPKPADVPALKIMQLQPAAKSLSGSEANSLKVAQPQNIPTNIGNLEAKSGDVIALTLAAETPTTKDATEETQTYISSDQITEGANAFYDESQTDVIPVDETPTTETPADTQQTTTDTGNAAPEGSISVPGSENAGQSPAPAPQKAPAAAATPSQTNTNSNNTTSNKDGNKMPLYVGLAIAAVVIILFITK